LGLAKAGLIEETKIGKKSIHGRKDYKVTMIGMEILIPYVIKTHPEIILTVFEYVDRFGNTFSYNLALNVNED
jgi:hypothetical protein